MKNCILIVTVFLLPNQLSPADIEQDLTKTLPKELKVLIIQYVATGKTFEESIKNITKTILTNQAWVSLLNDANAIRPLLAELSQKWNAPESAIAFALGTPGGQAWLKTKDISNRQILGELTQDQYLNSDFFNSIYFTKLANQLGMKALRSLVRYINERVQQMQKDAPDRGVGIFGHGGSSIAKLKDAHPDLYGALKSLALLLVQFPDAQKTLMNNYKGGMAILGARTILKLTLLPKLKDGSFKDAAKKLQENNPFVKVQIVPFPSNPSLFQRLKGFFNF